MKVLGTNKRTYNLHLVGYQPDLDDKRPRSKLHKQGRSVLYFIWPNDPICEEVPLPGCKYRLYADFFLPRQMLVVEMHGPQHYEQNSHFHKSPQDFYKGKLRDKEKALWCEVNNFRLVVLNDSETQDEWFAKLNEV